MNCPREYSHTTDDCGQFHVVTFLESQASLVFTDVFSKTLKTFSLTENAIQCLAGTGIQGQRDDIKAELYQPTSVCKELNTVFFCDTAVGKLRMITKPSGLLVFFENLLKFLNTFNVQIEKD